MIDQRNLIIAVILSIGILIAYQVFWEGPRQQARQAQIEQQRQAAIEAEQTETAPESAPQQAEGPRLGAALPAGQAGVPATGPGREEVMQASPRIRIESPRVRGSVALLGARIDDIILTDYRTTPARDSDPIVLLQPIGSSLPYYAEFGWLATERDVATPQASTVWSADRNVLTPNTPVTLRWDNGQGLTFERVLSIDNDYLITVTDRVRNNTEAPVTLNPYGLISRTGTPKIVDMYLLHEGLIGVFNETLKEVDYDDLRDAGTIRQTTRGGWLGITDKYWLAALIPDQQRDLSTSFNYGTRGAEPMYQADYVGAAFTVSPGGVVQETSHLFAGAKEVQLLDRYEEEIGVAHFDLAVDFGWFYFLTKPLFYALIYLHKALGNFGLAILALTVLIKLVFFPLANKSYASMSKMKKLQPKLMELRDRFPDDRQRLNQEMMALYKKEGANPAAGCLPILIQIPVFFALYKVLFVTIEMRHAPFFGWIRDLSQPDPLGVLTLFGIIPWDVPIFLSVLNIGIWPILMGLTMYVQMQLNPAPTDPIQAKIFTFMPIVFTFLLGQFPAGLVIYWAWNNLLSIIQQYVIMKRMGVPIGRNAQQTGGKT